MPENSSAFMQVAALPYMEVIASQAAIQKHRLPIVFDMGVAGYFRLAISATPCCTGYGPPPLTPLLALAAASSFLCAFAWSLLIRFLRSPLAGVGFFRFAAVSAHSSRSVGRRHAVFVRPHCQSLLFIVFFTVFLSTPAGYPHAADHDH
jgi:hypothetical protein